MRHQIIAITEGARDEERGEALFDLQTNDGDKLEFVAEFSVAEKIISGIARLCAGPRPSEHAGYVQAPDAHQARCRADPMNNQIVLMIEEEHGAQMFFCLPSALAKKLTGDLQTETARLPEPGHA